MTWDVIGPVVFAWGVFGIAQALAGFYQEHCMVNPQRDALRVRFENWWLKVADTEKLAFALSLARAFSDFLSRTLGSSIFSMRGFFRSAMVATGLLLASLCIFGLLGKAIDPLEEFEFSINIAKKAQYLPESKRTPIPEEDRAEVERRFKQITDRFDTPRWKWTYFAWVVISLPIINAVSFFLSLAVSRKTLKKITASGRPLTIFALLVTNLLLLFGAASILILVVVLVAKPILWFFLPLAILLSKAFPYWIPLLLLFASLASWTFSSPLVQVIAMIACLPAIVTVFMLLITWLAVLKRNWFHTACCWILLRCTGSKTITFITGCLILGGGVVAALAKLCFVWI